MPWHPIKETTDESYITNQEIYSIVKHIPNLNRKKEYLYARIMEKGLKNQQVFGRIVFIKVPDEQDFSLLVGRLDYRYDKHGNSIITFIELENNFNLALEHIEVVENVRNTLKIIREKYREKLPQPGNIQMSFFVSELVNIN